MSRCMSWKSKHCSKKIQTHESFLYVKKNNFIENTHSQYRSKKSEIYKRRRWLQLWVDGNFFFFFHSWCFCSISKSYGKPCTTWNTSLYIVPRDMKYRNKLQHNRFINESLCVKEENHLVCTFSIYM